MVQEILELSRELEFIKTANILEIAKNLPAEKVRRGGPDSQMLFTGAVPMAFINKYQTSNTRLKMVSDRLWRYLLDELTEAEGVRVDLERTNQEAILLRVAELFESNNYDERLAAGLAMEDLAAKLAPEDIVRTEAGQSVLQKMLQLIYGKYFPKKDVLIDSFASVMVLLDYANPFNQPNIM